MKILVVDDEQFIQESLGQFFKSKGEEVQTANDIKSALSQIEAFCPQLILLDVKLGEESGLDVIQYAKERHNEIRVILVTGFSDAAMQEKAKTLGADAIFFKPVIFSKLSNLIQEVMSR